MKVVKGCFFMCHRFYNSMSPCLGLTWLPAFLLMLEAIQVWINIYLRFIYILIQSLEFVKEGAHLNCLFLMTQSP